ncbi:hypothetical protein IG631_15536 [Alternaria alternata]|nr:hypothetical protein IG631_15536 [Alternaria alternata]
MSSSDDDTPLVRGKDQGECARLSARATTISLSRADCPCQIQQPHHPTLTNPHLLPILALPGATFATVSKTQDG